MLMTLSQNVRRKVRPLRVCRIPGTPNLCLGPGSDRGHSGTRRSHERQGWLTSPSWAGRQRRFRYAEGVWPVYLENARAKALGSSNPAFVRDAEYGSGCVGDPMVPIGMNRTHLEYLAVLRMGRRPADRPAPVA